MTSYCTASIHDAEDRYVRCAYARRMPTAVRDAVADALTMLHDEQPRFYIRDSLGGLRAEVWLDAAGKPTAKVTA